MSKKKVSADEVPTANRVFAKLRDVLADIYPDNDSAQIIVADIGLATGNIAFTAMARTNWHRILAAAVRQAKTEALLTRAEQDGSHYEPFQVAVNTYRSFIASGGNLTIIPEEISLSDKSVIARPKNNPWSGGTFYLFVFVVVMASLVIAANYVEWYVLPAILIAALLAIPLIGVLQSLNDGTLSEKGFLQVVMESYRRLPLLKRGGS